MIDQIALSPLGLGVLLLILLTIAWRWLPRPLRYAGVIAEILLLGLMTPLGANLLVRGVESRTPSPRSCPAPWPDTIVLLSGGVNRPPLSADDFEALSAESLHRLFSAERLWRQSPHSRLVIAGGDENRIAQSVLLARLARELGVSADSIRIEQRSRTTWEDARDVAALSPPLPARIWLVSSALHLPRALATFRAFGFQPCAWSSGSAYVPPGGLGYVIPQSSALNKSEAAVHEIVGGFLYTWRIRKKH